MILVTGATGLIGSHLLFHLLKKESAVRAIYRNKEKQSKVKKVFSYYSYDYQSIFDKIEWVKADILDIPELEKAFYNISKVYHAAALVSFDAKDKNKMYRTNVEGTANIVNLCIHFSIKKLCYVSSIATLGTSTFDISEDTLWNPNDKNSMYSISKNEAEMEVWRGIEEGQNTVIVNPSIVIGPGFWDNSSGKLFSTVSRGMRFFSKGKSGFVGVNDLVEIMITLMNSDIKENRYIINAENLTYKKVLSTIAKSINLKAPNIIAPKWLLTTILIIDTLKSILTGSKNNLSLDSIRSATNIKTFDNNKIKKELSYTFESIDSVIKKTSFIFLEEK